MKKLMVAAVAGAVALGAQAETFLEGLADASQHPIVDSSPVATGGDLIYHIVDEGAGVDDYVHIFTNPAPAEAYSFNLTANRKVTYLAVAGGGGGANRGGGGGAGGLLCVTNAVFMKGDYTITVGKGGTGGSSKGSRGGNGGDSTVFFGETELLRADGGGGGGTEANSTGKDGGSGGGATVSSAQPGLGFPGQGHNGGVGQVSSLYSNGRTGGGGGAGAPGTSSAGGAGLSCEITGKELWYAGGGAGGPQSGYGSKVSGGKGGGGSCANYNSDGDPGVNGQGGGGAGGGGNSNFSYKNGGAGGSGIVVLRYAAEETVSSEPVVIFQDVHANTDGSVTISYMVGECGGTESCSVSAVWGYDANALSFTNLLSDTAGVGVSESTFAGVLPGRTYCIGIFAANATGASSALSELKSFTVPTDAEIPAVYPAVQPVVSEVVVKDRTGGGYVLIEVGLSQPGTDCVYEDCTARLKWGVTENYNGLTSVVELPVGSDGCVVFRPDIPTVDTYYFCVEVVNASGFIDRTPISSFCANDTSTYTWKEGVTEGAWENPANWTGAPNDWGLGYPMNNACADFTSVLCATVHVSTAVSCNWYRKERKGGEYVFIGDTDTASISTKSHHLTVRDLQGDQKLVFDHIKAQVATYDVRLYTLSANDTLILTNGASLTPIRGGTTITGFSATGKNCRLALYGASDTISDNYGFFVGGEGAELVVSGRSRVTTRELRISAGASVAIDDSTVSASNLYLPSDGAAPTVTLSGANPSLKASSKLISTTEGASIVCVVPAEGWTTAAPFGVSSQSEIAGNFVLSVPKTAPIRGSSIKTAKESKIVSMSPGIDVAKVVFGTTAKGSDYFYFADADGNPYRSAAEIPAETTVTGVWYHHEPSSGMMLIVK